ELADLATTEEDLSRSCHDLDLPLDGGFACRRLRLHREGARNAWRDRAGGLRAAGGALERLVRAHREVAQDLLVLAHPVLDLRQGRLAHLRGDVEQEVLAFVDLVDRESELAAAPVLLGGDLAATGSDHV